MLRGKFVPLSATCRSQWPRGLRRRSAAARFLGLLFRIPPWTWTYVSRERCVFSGRGLCDGLSSSATRESGTTTIQSVILAVKNIYRIFR